MADVQINQLSEAGHVYDSDLLVLEQSGVAKKLQAQTLHEHIFSAPVWTELKGKVDTVESNVNTISGRAETIEASIGDIESKLAEIESGGVRKSLITKHPEDIIAVNGETFVLRVEVDTDAVKSYRWQYASNGAWYNASTGTYNTAEWSVVAKTTNDGRLYRCQVTGKDGTVEFSNPAELYCSEVGYTKYPYKNSLIIETVLQAGRTTVEFTDNRLNNSSNISVYTDDPQGEYTFIRVTGATITIGFDARETDLSVKLVVM